MPAVAGAEGIAPGIGLARTIYAEIHMPEAYHGRPVELGSVFFIIPVQNRLSGIAGITAAGQR